MSTTAARARWAVAEAIRTRLEVAGPARLKVFLGDVTDSKGQAIAPPLLPNTQRVAPYAVVHGGAGQPAPGESLAALSTTDALITGQVTFVAAFPNDLLDLLDDVVPLLHLWTPVIDGLSCGRLRQQLGFDAGPVRRDDNTRPPRFMSPWLWQLHVATAVPA